MAAKRSGCPAGEGDVIRAVVGYALAEDAIGLARFREKYAPLMSAEPDRSAFDADAIPGRHREGAAAAGNGEGRSVPDRLAACDCRIEAGRGVKIGCHAPRSS
jgi:hypothetical protein